MWYILKLRSRKISKGDLSFIALAWPIQNMKPKSLHESDLSLQMMALSSYCLRCLKVVNAVDYEDCCILWRDVMWCSLQPTTRLHNTSQNTAVFMVLAVMKYGHFKAQAPNVFLLLSGCLIFTNMHLDTASNKNTFNSSLCHYAPSLKDKHQHNWKR